MRGEVTLVTRAKFLVSGGGREDLVAYLELRGGIVAVIGGETGQLVKQLGPKYWRQIMQVDTGKSFWGTVKQKDQREIKTSLLLVFVVLTSLTFWTRLRSHSKLFLVLGAIPLRNASISSFSKNDAISFGI